MSTQVSVQPEFSPLSVDPGLAALLVVDVENEFCRPDGKMFLSERVFPAIQRLKALLTRCRAAHVPVIFVRSVREPSALEFTAFDHKPTLLRGTSAVEFVDGVVPGPGEPVVEKHSHDPFNNTQLEPVLASLGIQPAQHTVLVAGVATHVCVTCAVIGLSVRDFRVALLADCSASATEEYERLAYQLFASRAYNYNVQLTTSDLVSFEAAVIG